MINRNCKPGNKAQKARRIAGMLMTGTLAGTLAAGGAGAVRVSAATWQENADYIFDYLTQNLGYSEAAACGIMANIRCESTFNPHAWNAGGGSYGLCQWTGGRYGRLQSWCGSNGYDYTTIDGQLAYLQYELESHYPGVEQHLRSVENNADGAYDAGQYYCYHFEAPASRGSVSVYRGGLASGTFWDSYRPAEWYQVDGIWHYILRDGSYQTQWLTIDDETFYMDDDGNRISGWRTVDGNRYFFDKDGVMVTGWQKVDGKSYYFDSDGALVTGIVHHGDDWYLLDETGNVQACADMQDFAPGWLTAAAEREEAVSLASAAEGEEAVSLVSAADDAASTDSVSEVNNETADSPAGDLAESEETALAAADKATELRERQTETAMQTGAASGLTAPFALSMADASSQADENTENAISSVEALRLAAGMTAEDTQEVTASLAETASEETVQTAATASSAATDESASTAATDERASASTAATDERASASATTSDEAAAASTATSDQTASASTAATDEAAAALAMQTAASAIYMSEESEEENAEIGSSGRMDDSRDQDSHTDDRPMENNEGDDSQDEAENAGEGNHAESASTSVTTEEAEYAQTSETKEEAASGNTMQASLSEEDLKIRVKEDHSSRRDDDKSKEKPARKEKVHITLEDDIPEISLDDIHNLVKILKEEEILHAETESGIDLTDEVETSFERIGEGYREYKVTFTLEYNGSSDEVESTVFVRAQ